MNVAALVAYALAVALVLASSAWLLERALTTLRLPVRWVWIGALVLSVWLPSASFVSAPELQDTAGVTGGVVVAPIAPTGVVEGMTGGSGQGAGGALELLVAWRTGVRRGLASAAALLPRIGVTPAWIAGVWGASSILVAMILIASTLRLSRLARRWPDERLLGWRVKVSPGTGPATMGLLAPLIVIPRWARELPSQELEMVLRHEGEHVRSRDTLLLALGLVAVVACPWNPLVWWEVRRLKAAVEVDCDRRVLRGGVAPARYGDLLVRLGSRGRPGSLAVPTMAGSTSLLERRLTTMKESRGRTSYPTALAAMASALLLVVVACTTEAPVATERKSAPESSTATNARVASERSGEDVVAAIWMDRDGAVQVNGVAYPVDQVSEAVAPLHSAGAVVSIEAHQAAPYRAVAAVQDQLRAAGLLRVVFTAVESEARRSSTRDVSTLVDAGLAMVLPDATMPAIDEMTVDPRNLLFLEVLPTGLVAARRGEDPRIQEIAPGDVEALWRHEVAQDPRLIAVVRTRPEAEYRHMYEVVEALRRAEATRFTLQLAE